MASVQRQPFGEIGASRLQGLTSQKNCQNAITDILNRASKKAFSKPQSTPLKTKRPYTPAEDDSDADTENQDPSLFASKGSKSSGETPSKKLKLNVVPNSSIFTTSNKPSTPTSPLFSESNTNDAFTFNNTSGANSAPAGRSPKNKRVGLLGKKRSSMSPFKRLNPPAFGSSGRGEMPFSIDAALNGTLSGSKPPASVPAPVHAGSMLAPTILAARPKAATIEESMPSGWFFEIHEDTADQEASNLMEHSTGILDISSDDEASPRKKDDRGKENVPPIDYVGNVGNGATAADIIAQSKSRRIDPDAMKDVGEERAPLSPLNEEEFFGNGLDKTSVEIVKPETEHEQEEHAEKKVAASPELTATADDDEYHDEAPKQEREATHPIPEPLPIEAQTASDPEQVPGFEIAVDSDCKET